eukprot:TRINITY_DN68395_c0_g1_i1.p1 TRINITY_DN68395_c0_g1~~TRINITY_DN68395_c0_g1_i1.p1  ORF type:complete len:200 (+),score=47.84 TRINITY_DN68395_c0_g1_i1:42-641(+)
MASEPETEAAASAEVAEIVFENGDRVMLKDLAGAKHLNGTTGRILHLEEKSGRWAVQLTKDGSKKLLKPANIHKLVADQDELRKIFESDAKTTKKLRTLTTTGELGFAEFSDPDLCSMLRRLLSAGYWAENPELMDDLATDLDLAELPKAPVAMKFIKELESCENLTWTLNDMGCRVHSDPELKAVFDKLKERGHDFDF